jgi:hypothetical protein
MHPLVSWAELGGKGFSLEDPEANWVNQHPTDTHDWARRQIGHWYACAQWIRAADASLIDGPGD